jgi:hypothetical protein
VLQQILAWPACCILNAGLQEVPESENKYKNSNEMCIMDEVPEKQAILKAITKY